MIKPFFYLALFAATAFAWMVEIGFPPDGANVTAGDNLVVQVRRPPMSQVGFDEVGLVLGFQSLGCSGAHCNPPNGIGDILYNGPFEPQSYEQNLPPYQNFTVRIPSSVANGNASLSVTHFAIVMDLRAGMNYSYTEGFGQNVTVV